MSVKWIQTPFDCHICDWAYVDIHRLVRGIHDKYYCKCRICKRKTELCDNPEEAVKQYKQLKAQK